MIEACLLIFPTRGNDLAKSFRSHSFSGEIFYKGTELYMSTFELKCTKSHFFSRFVPITKNKSRLQI